jgi:putative phosphoesterase
MDKIGILSDAHGNVVAFQIALKKLRQLGAEYFIFLGDAVGYIPSLGVLDCLSLMGASVRCVLGNHEHMLLNERVTSCHDDIYMLGTIREYLTSQHVDFLGSWEKGFEAKFGHASILCIHGSPQDPTFGYLYPDSDLSAQRSRANFIFMGNTHRPFVRVQDDNVFVNVGSCGLPRDDGRYGAACLFTPITKSVQIIRFDITTSISSVSSLPSPPHSIVMEIFKRRSNYLFGELI